MKYLMAGKKKNFKSNNKSVAGNDAYAKLMLYSVVEKFIIFNEVFLTEYKRFMKQSKLPCSDLYRLMTKVNNSLAFKLRRVGVLVISETPFELLRNKVIALLPYNEKRMFMDLAIDLYKLSKLKAILEVPFCADLYDFSFDYSKLEKRDIKVQVSDVDCSLISGEDFEKFSEQLEKAFKKVESKDELILYLDQFFNFKEDINDCHNIASKKAC